VAGSGERRVVLVACGDRAVADAMGAAFAGDEPGIELAAAADCEQAMAVIEARRGELLAVIADDALPARERSSGDAWTMVSWAEVACDQAYRAMICADPRTPDGYALLLNGGQPWPRARLDRIAARIRLRIAACRWAPPALAIAIGALADDAGLSVRHAEVIACHAVPRGRKGVAEMLGIGERTVQKHIAEILARLRQPNMRAAGEDVLRRAFGIPRLPAGGGGVSPRTIPG